jgi:DNA-binding LytR/AlgR family response regulator
MTRALIAEDEPELRHGFVRMLNKLWPELEICAQASNGEEALAQYKKHRPEIVFLDIRMPGRSGMEIAGEMRDCKVVFVTAYDQFAVEAFEKYAVDYILKPVAESRLAKTVAKLKSGTVSEYGPLEDAIKLITARISSHKNGLQWVKALEGDTVRLLNVDEIAYFKSADKYTVVRTAAGETIIRSSLKTLEAELDPNYFWKVHRNTIVNVRWIEKAQRLFAGKISIRLKGLPDELDVSRQYSHLFHQT